MESHSFTNLKHDEIRRTPRLVDLRGATYRAYPDGRVFKLGMAGAAVEEIFKLSPLAAEVRKASGIFE